MLGDWFWQYLFDTYVYLANYMQGIQIISWTDDAGVSHTISLFTVAVSYLVVQVVISVILAFNETGIFDDIGDD